jgi:uncharacterized membrane protein YfcA
MLFYSEKRRKNGEVTMPSPRVYFFFGAGFFSSFFGAGFLATIITSGIIIYQEFVFKIC